MARTADRIAQLRRTAANAVAYDLDCELLTPAGPRSCGRRCAVDDLLGAIWLPGDGRSTRPTSPSRSPAAPGWAAPGRSSGCGSPASRSRTARAARVTGVRTDAGDVECEVVVNCAGQWAALGRPGRGHRAAALLRALLRGHRADRGRPPGPADPARPRRLDLLQGGGRRPGRRRVRARRQAVAVADDLPHPFEFQLLEEDWEHFALADGRGDASGSRRSPRPASASSTTALSRFTPDNQFLLGRGARAARLLRRRRLQLGRHRVRRRRRPGPGRVGRRGRADERPGRPSTSAGSRRSTATRLAAVAGGRGAGPALRRPLAATGSRAGRPRGSRPCTSARRAGRRVRHPERVGAAAGLRLAGRSRRSTTPGGGPLARPGRSPSRWPPAPVSRSSTRPRSPSTSSPDPTRWPPCSGSAPPTSTSGRRGLHAVAQRPRQLRGRPDRHRTGSDSFLLVSSSATTVRDLDWLARHVPVGAACGPRRDRRRSRSSG